MPRYEQVMDPRGERDRKRNENKILAEIAEMLGEDDYEEIIKALIKGDLKNLTPEQKQKVAEVREKMNNKMH